MKITNISKIWGLLITFLCISISLQGQQKLSPKNIDSLFLKHSSVYKEVVYVHLNKSIYVKGEVIAFTSYVLNKHNQNLSDKTSNLYCVIYDSNQNLVKKQMIKVEDGVANGAFIIDDNFKKGNYTFKAYTNWMLNFSQENFFTDSFEVLDPDATKFVEKKAISSKIDLQVLPESGHLLSGVNNVLGVVAKDSLGYGYPFLKGNVLDDNNSFITSFTLNKLGIGRFSMTPKKNMIYKVVDQNGNNIATNFGEDTQDNGILLQLNRNEDYILVSAHTNKSTLPFLKRKEFMITYHNGIKLIKIKVNFNKGSIVTKKIALNDLNKGINIFTLFDINNQPIAERLFFNYKSLNINTIEKATTHIKNDTIFNFDLSLKNRGVGFNNVSVSVLPKETKSYKKNSNIISNVLIKPYVKGYIENGGYYFTNITNQKKYDLDNLLITQGWSSFDWKDVFYHQINYRHTFEKGISLKINLQDKKTKRNSFFVHSSSNRGPEFITFDKEVNKKSFGLDHFYPLDDENVFISKVSNSDGKLEKTSFYTQFYPAKVPETDKSATYLIPNSNFYAIENAAEFFSFKTENANNVLDEVVITTNLEKQRIKKIKSSAIGNVKFTKENDVFYTLVEYINMYGVGFLAQEQNGTVLIRGGIKRSNMRKPMGGDIPELDESKQPSDESAKEPTLPNLEGQTVVYIDGVKVLNNDVLYNFYMDRVDYVEFDHTGFGEGIRGAYGVIHIVTDIFKFYKESKKPTFSKIKFPLTFTKPTKFYVPKYKSYQSDFYKNYGVIDWLPINKVDENGNLKLTINNIKTDEITLFIEGVTADGTFIFDKKTINIKPNKNF